MRIRIASSALVAALAIAGGPPAATAQAPADSGHYVAAVEALISTPRALRPAWIERELGDPRIRIDPDGLHCRETTYFPIPLFCVDERDDLHPHGRPLPIGVLAATEATGIEVCGDGCAPRPGRPVVRLSPPLPVDSLVAAHRPEMAGSTFVEAHVLVSDDLPGRPAVGRNVVRIRFAPDGGTEATLVRAQPGPVAEIRTPYREPVTIVEGDTARLRAEAVDGLGRVLDVPLVWSLPASFHGRVDETTGVFEARSMGLIRVTVRAPPELRSRDPSDPRPVPGSVAVLVRRPPVTDPLAPAVDVRRVVEETPGIFGEVLEWICERDPYDGATYLDVRPTERDPPAWLPDLVARSCADGVRADAADPIEGPRRVIALSAPRLVDGGEVVVHVGFAYRGGTHAWWASDRVRLARDAEGWRVVAAWTDSIS